MPPPIDNTQTGANVVAITGTGNGPDAKGVRGVGNGTRAIGVRGEGNDTAVGHAVGVSGSATGKFSVGVKGEAETTGVLGIGKTWHGVHGTSTGTANGVYGFSEGGTGIAGESKTAYNAGIFGIHKGSSGWGVRGDAQSGTGISGTSKTGFGVVGDTGESVTVQLGNRIAGVYGVFNGAGHGCGVLGESKSPEGPGVLGRGLFAGHFEGTVWVDKDLAVRGAMSGPTIDKLRADVNDLIRRVSLLEGR